MRKRYTYIPNSEIESLTTWNGKNIPGDKLLDGAYARGNVKYANGGDIKNQYKDNSSPRNRNRSAKDIWESWSDNQRTHFLSDHSHKITNSLKYVYLSFNDLPFQVKDALKEHIIEGQYAKGGVAFSEKTGKLEKTKHFVVRNESGKEILKTKSFNKAVDTRHGTNNSVYVIFEDGNERKLSHGGYMAKGGMYPTILRKNDRVTLYIKGREVEVFDIYEYIQKKFYYNVKYYPNTRNEYLFDEVEFEDAEQIIDWVKKHYPNVIITISYKGKEYADGGMMEKGGEVPNTVKEFNDKMKDFSLRLGNAEGLWNVDNGKSYFQIIKERDKYVEKTKKEWYKTMGDEEKRGDMARYKILQNMIYQAGLDKMENGGMMAKGGRTRYNTGRSWTLDHYQFNKKENYEIPVKKRKRL